MPVNTGNHRLNRNRHYSNIYYRTASTKKVADIIKYFSVPTIFLITSGTLIIIGLNAVLDKENGNNFNPEKKVNCNPDSAKYNPNRDCFVSTGYMQITCGFVLGISCIGVFFILKILYDQRHEIHNFNEYRQPLFDNNPEEVNTPTPRAITPSPSSNNHTPSESNATPNEQTPTENGYQPNDLI